MVAQVGALRVAVGADISELISGMNRAQGAVKRGAEVMSKSAKASAKVFADAKRQADSLLGSVDPLYAAQTRYDRELAKAQELMKAGALTAGELARVQAGLKTQLDSTAKSYSNLATTGSRTRAGFTQLSFQIGDVAQGLALGTRASTIFAQQSGQVIQSLQIMGGQTNAFLRFIGGPWGIAISTAAVVLTPFIGKLFDTKNELKDLIDKMREQAKQAALNEQADAAWKRTIEGLTDSIRKRREEQEKQLKTDIQQEEDSLSAARRELGTAQKRRADLEAQIREAERRLANVRQSPAGLTEEEDKGRAAAIIRAQERVKTLRAELQKLNGDIAKAEANVRGAQAPISERAVEGRIDEVAKATNEYTRTLGDLRSALQAGTITQKVFEDRLEAARKKLDAVKDAAKETAKASIAAFKASVIGAEGTGPNKLGSPAAGFGQFMPQTWLTYFNRLFPDKRDLSDAAKLGFRNVRETANAVIDKATDDYVKVLKKAGQEITAANLYAVHLLGAAGATKLFKAAPNTDTRKLFGDTVVNKKGVVDQNPFLAGTAAQARAAIAKRIGDSSGSVSSASAAIDRELADQAERELRQQNDFQQARDQLNQRILEAQGALARGVEAQAAEEEKRILADEERNANAINADLAEGKYGEATSETAKARAQQLLTLNHSLAVEKISAIQIEKRAALEEAAFRLGQQQRDFALDALRFADETATTQADHRRIQLQILDAQIEQKRLELEHEKQLAIRNGATADEIQLIQDKLDHLGTERAEGAARVEAGTRNPLEDWAASIPQTAQEITEAFQKIQADGLDRLSDSLADVILGTKSLKEAAHEMAASFIADTIRVITRMLLLKAITAAFGGFGGSAGGGGVGDVTSSGIYPTDLGFAKGGSFTIGGRGGTDANLMSINGLPIARVSKGERVSVSNDNGGGTGTPVSVTFHNDFRGADSSAVAAIQARLDRMQAELPSTIVNTVQDAKQRHYFR